MQFRGWVYRAYRKSQNLTHMPNLGKRNGHFTPFSTIRLRFAPAAVGVCVSYLTFQTTNGFPLVLPENHQYVYLIFPNNCYFARSFPNQPCLITGRWLFQSAAPPSTCAQIHQSSRSTTSAWKMAFKPSNGSFYMLLVISCCLNLSLMLDMRIKTDKNIEQTEFT